MQILDFLCKTDFLCKAGKTRDIDVIATDSDYLGVVVTHFVIECKSSKKPWILLSSDDALSNYKNLLALGVLSENVLKVLASRITSEESLHALPWLSMGRRGGYALRQAFSKNLDVAYTAAISVAKACGNLAHSTDVGSEEAPHGAGLRPPLKRTVFP